MILGGAQQEDKDILELLYRNKIPQSVSMSLFIYDCELIVGIFQWLSNPICRVNGPCNYVCISEKQFSLALFSSRLLNNVKLANLEHMRLKLEHLENEIGSYIEFFYLGKKTFFLCKN